MTRRVLIVSPYFPPSTLAGVHRARHLAKHLPAAGWTPTVLCVDEAYHEQRLDPALARLLPPDLDLVKVAAWPVAVTRRFGLGEIGLRAYAQLAEGIRDIFTTRDPDVVLITGSPFYPMLLARMIKRRYGKPVVLDFQDPWVSAWGAAQPKASKAGMAHALARVLEPTALRHADFVTAVSERQNMEMADRYPWLDRSLMAAIPIGGDADDYDALERHGECCASLNLPNDRFNFVYVGTLLPRAAGVVVQLFKALARLRAQNNDLARRCRFMFVGTSNQSSDRAEPRVMPLATAEGVADLVAEVPERVPYLRALSLLKRADTILLIGSDEPHYTASKIYPALLSGRPCLGLFHQASSAFDILAAASSAEVLGFSSLADLASRSEQLVATLSQAVVGGSKRDCIDRSAVAPYEAARIAGVFAEVLERAVRC